MERFNTGAYADIGQRDKMEDAHFWVQDLRVSPDIPISYFGVFDGHGGPRCANYLKKHLHYELARTFTRNRLFESKNFNKTLIDSIFETYQKVDLDYKKEFPKQCAQVGSTAVVILIIGDILVSVNLGDARAVLCREGKAVDLSIDYKASRKDEQERIKSQGGYIVFGRVLGRLAVTRAFGDFECKQIKIKDEATQETSLRNFVLNEPEIRITYLNKETDDFLLLASDGLFDRFTSKDCVQLAREKFATMNMMEQDPRKVAEFLVKESTSARINSDNTTVLVVALNAGVDPATVEKSQLG